MQNLIAWVDELKAALHIPASIKEAGVAEDEFLAKVDHLAEQAFDDQCTGANPRYPLISELKQILLDTYYGRPYQELYAREAEPAATKETKGKKA